LRVSAALKSQVLAIQAAMLSTYLPSLLLSGFMFSIASMPVALRAFTYLVPARYYIVITRGTSHSAIREDDRLISPTHRQ